MKRKGTNNNQNSQSHSSDVCIYIRKLGENEKLQEMGSGFQSVISDDTKNQQEKEKVEVGYQMKALLSNPDTEDKQEMENYK